MEQNRRLQISTTNSVLSHSTDLHRMILEERRESDYLNIVQDTERALELVRNVLSSQKSPRVLTSSEFHLYEDKYAVCDFLGTVSLNAIFGLLDLMGLEEERVPFFHNIAQQQGKGLTMRFISKCKCEFLEEYEAKKEMMSHVVEYDISKKDTAVFNPSIPFITKKTQQNASVESRTFVKVKEYKWLFTLEYKIYLFAGNEDESDAESSIILKRATSSCHIVNTGKKEPPVDVVPLTLQRDLFLTSLMRKFVPDQAMFSFSIDRMDESCRTPRRNTQIEEFQSSLQQTAVWFRDIIMHLQKVEALCSTNGESTTPTSIPKLSSLDDKDVFNPIMPLLLSNTTAETEGDSAPTINRRAKDIQELIAYHKRSMKEKMNVLSSLFLSQDSSDNLMTMEQVHLTLIASNAVSLIHRWQTCINYIESMLQEQLISAIGKVISSSDLQQFTRFHFQTFFADAFIPEPFSYAIRRPEHYPDGILSIEAVSKSGSLKDSATSLHQPIYTLTRKVSYESFDDPLKIPINAATNILCTCDRFLHGWIRQSFLKEDDLAYQLAARARQFSSFLLIIGTLAGPNLFQPDHAIIVKNKDEILIPLILNALPSAKEFKDAISSLSPEQQDFAKTFRQRQLSSSVFGICVIQLKPQLELLLGLPINSLTKEIRLNEELLQLFIDYQIPSDLLSFDGSPAATVAEKVTAVKGYVKAVMDVIEQSNEDSLNQSKKAAEMNLYQTLSHIQPQQPKRMLKCVSASPPSPCSAPTASFVTQSIMLESNFGARLEPQGESSSITFEDHYPDPNKSCTSAYDEDVDYRKEKYITEPSSSKNKASNASQWEVMSGSIDFTRIPHHLDTQFEKDHNMKATIIETGDMWKKKSKADLLSKLTESFLWHEERRTEKDKAFDLLDAISRSGSLPISCAELHVVIATTTNFTKSVIDTIVEDNINPIRQMEVASTVVAAAIHGDIPARNLLRREADLLRLVKASNGRHRCLCESQNQQREG